MDTIESPAQTRTSEPSPTEPYAPSTMLSRHSGPIEPDPHSHQGQTAAPVKRLDKLEHRCLALAAPGQSSGGALARGIEASGTQRGAAYLSCVIAERMVDPLDRARHLGRS